VTERQRALPLDRLPASAILEDRHYLGRSHRVLLVHQDALGVMAFAAPTARNLPKAWLELTRWCITGDKNAGSQQWKVARGRLLAEFDAVTTVVSYSDPSVGHTGALYRASGWLWAPTWQRLFPPPTGNGAWIAGKTEAVKDRWVALLRPDVERQRVLSVGDSRIRRIPWAEYREPRWKRGVPQLTTGGGDYNRWIRER